MLIMGEHLLWASAENLSTHVQHVFCVVTNIAESDCADGQMEEPKELFACTDVVHNIQLLAVYYEQFGHFFTDFLVQQ
jgi:hypothetical protein